MTNEIRRCHDIILIDDDEIVRRLWKYQADRTGLNFSSFASIDEFLNSEHQIHLESFIFVDSNLGEGIKGEVESRKIADKGFQNIYLATGYQENDLKIPGWIKGVFGKEPQFDQILPQ